MPNPTSHLCLVYDLIDTKSDSMVEYLLLGSITPDIRVITKTPRKDFHYFDLKNGKKGDGVKNFILKNKYASSKQNNRQTRLFLVGYLSHLIADENWTVDVFRKIFMNKEIFPDFNQALLLDRALQIYLDLYLYNTNKNIYSYLNNLDLGKIILPSNINNSDLLKWVDFVSDLNKSFSEDPWSRLDFMAKRLSYTYESESILNFCIEFKKNIDKNINELLEKIPENYIDIYINDTKTSIENILKELY